MNRPSLPFFFFSDFASAICFRHLVVAVVGAVLFFFARVETADGATIVMNGSDALNASSFNSGLHWTGGAAPVAGNAYQTSTFLLRTPANNTSIAFAGDSLEIQATGEFRIKSSAIITVNNLAM